MRKEQRTKKSAEEKRTEWRISRVLLREFLVSGFAGIVFSLLGAFLSIYASISKSPGPDILSLSHSLVYFVGGIVLLGIVIVGVASFMRRKDRDVILLTQRLAEIYLLAIRKSALNPEFWSMTSND